MAKFGKEKRVSTRVRGLEANLLERSGLTNGQLVRYGLRKFYEEHPESNEHRILTEIDFLRDKIEEYEMHIEAASLLIQKKTKELHEVRQDREDKVYWYIVEKMYDEYLLFIDDDSLTDEFRYDLKNFYSYCRSPIHIIAMQTHKECKEVIKMFEDYLEFKFGDDALGDELLDDVSVI